MALFSEAYITAIAATCGCDYQRTRTDDDSIDAYLSSRQIGRPRLEVQIKSTATIADTREHSATFPFRLEMKNYDELRLTEDELIVPRLLVVLLMPKEAGDWIEHGDRHALLRHDSFFLNLARRPAVTGQSHTVQIPWKNAFTVSSLRSMMDHIANTGALP